jgi:LmbE family N-acetylglucosaminyl deacetylase
MAVTVNRFVSDLQQNWDERPFVWTDKNVPPGLRMPSNARVLALGPHPDDAESVAVTCRLLLHSGCDLRFAIVCTSPSGVEDSYAELHGDRSLGTTPAERKIAIRKKEQIASAGKLGLSEDKVTFLSLDENENGMLSDSPTDRARIGHLLQSTNPDMVILPVGKDTNRTHAWVWRVFRESARRLFERERRPMVALYSEDPKTTDMGTDLFVLFGEESARWKSALLRTHDSQQQRNLHVRQSGFDERILQVNRRRYDRFSGAESLRESSFRYAEAFEIERFGF